MIKQTINRIALAAVLVIVSISAWADRVAVDALTNGVITVGTVAESGEQTVTLTVTPANNYYIETSDIIVNKTQAIAQAPQRRAPGYADKLTVTAVSVDATGKGTYQFTVPDGYGAYVQATFHACMAINPTVNITGWTYGSTANEPSVTGNSGQGSVVYTYAKQGTTAFSSDVPQNAGDYTVKAVIAAAGHYLGGEATKDFTIAKAAGSVSFADAIVDKTYGDAPFTNALTHTGDGSVTYASDKPSVATVNATTGQVTIVSAGAAKITVTVTDGDNYTYAAASANYTLNVAAKALQNDMIQAIADLQFTGEPQTPQLTVKDGETLLTLDTDYTVAYSDNVNVGTATVTITGKGNYKGTATATFTITKKAGTISYGAVTVSKTFGDAPFTNPLTNTGDGAVTYTSSEPSVATVNATTGEVTIVGNGDTEIKATVTDGQNYTYAVKTASYMLGVGTVAMTVSATNYEGVYDQAAHGIKVTVTNPADATVKYGETEGDYSLTESPQYQDVGTYYVYYQVTKENYTTVKGSATVTITAAAGAISYGTAIVDKKYDDAPFTNALTNTGDGAVTYATNKPEVATVNATTGEVTIHAAGDATITATVADGKNYTYAVKTATYTLKVGKAAGSISYAENDIKKAFNDAAFTNALTLTGDGVVTYSSDNPAAATVNATTGEVTLKDVGETTITATVTDGANYTYATPTATYKLTVGKAAATISYAVSEVGKAFGDAAFTNALTNTGDGAVTYTSDNASVATVDAATGEVTILGNGTANITATVTDGTHYTYATPTASYKLIVGTAVMVVTSEGYSGIYDGASHQIVVNAPEGATVKYGVTAGSYPLSDNPAYTNVGSYTVYYKVTKQNYEDVTGSQTVTITAKPLADAMIQAMEPVVYTGQELTPAVTVKDGENTLVLNTDYTVAYADNMNAGTASVTVTGKGNYQSTATATFTITQKAAAVSYEVAVVNKVYGDAPFTNALTNTGDGAVTYATNKPEVATVNATTGEVTIHAAGDATITATVADGKNYTYAVKTSAYTLKVGKSDIVSYTAPVGLTLVYTGQPQVLVTPGQVEGGEMQYSQDNETWSTDLPTGKEIKDYTVYYRIIGDQNHHDVAVQSVSASIKGLPVTVAAGEFITYCSDRTLTLDEGAEAELYTVSSIAADKVVLSDKLTIVPQGVPILIYNPTGAELTAVLIPTSDDTEVTYDNTHFFGTLSEQSFTAADTEAADYYICNGREFVRVEGAGTLRANRAYLKVGKSVSQSAPRLTIGFGGNNGTTGVDSMQNAQGTMHNDFYDLNGRKLQGKPTQKGLYIKNGRKVVIK